jgi:hypothetical protein
MNIPRNRRLFAQALVSTLAFAFSVGLLAPWDTGRGAVLSADAAASAPEFGYSGDNGPGFWGETAGWRPARARLARSDSRRLTSTTSFSIGTSVNCQRLGRRWPYE